MIGSIEVATAFMLILQTETLSEQCECEFGFKTFSLKLLYGDGCQYWVLPITLSYTIWKC